MNAKIKKLSDELQNSGLLPLFEVKTMDLRTNEEFFVCFEIFIHKHTIYAQHTALNRKEEKSKKIACKKLVIDPDFSLDHHLQELYSICLDALYNSEFYETED